MITPHTEKQLFGSSRKAAVKKRGSSLLEVSSSARVATSPSSITSTIMCSPSSPEKKNKANSSSSTKNGVAALGSSSSTSPLKPVSEEEEPFKKKRYYLLVLLSLWLLVVVLPVSVLYLTNARVHRSIEFWRRISPIAIEYKYVQLRSKYSSSSTEDSEQQICLLQQFHQKTAPKLVALLQDFGGMMIKVGQVAGTIGTGLFDESYIQALRVLQDGVQPRDFAEIRALIESNSGGATMEELFLHFDPVPIGAASIGQAHKATLTDGQQVVVKVQYPDVEQTFATDFNNMELALRLVNPNMLDFCKNIRQRHEKELDFRLEAANLRRISANMQAHGVEPSLVRIPRVRNETGLCTRHVLAMEYLDGTPLSTAIDEEQERVARALGKANAQELRDELRQQMREYFESSGHDHAKDNKKKKHANGMMLQNAMTPSLAAKVFRVFVGAKAKVDQTVKEPGKAVRALLHGSSPQIHQHDPLPSQTTQKENVNLHRVLKTLIQVHGLQMIKDGTYNADPHPGNVLVLKDGRLGLLDYGMVVELSESERLNVAQVVLALANQDKHQAARLYRDAGYKSSWHTIDGSSSNTKNDDGSSSSSSTAVCTMDDPGVLHRFATWHLDRMDMSPVACTHGPMNFVDLMRSVKEHNIPRWIESARRLGALLMGVSAQAGRPMPLSKEWKAIAQQVVREEEVKQERRRKQERTKQ